MDGGHLLAAAWGGPAGVGPDLPRPFRPQRQFRRPGADVGEGALPAFGPGIQRRRFRACLRPAALLACARLELRHAAGRDRTKQGARARCRHRQGTLAARGRQAGCALGARLRQHRPARNHRHAGDRPGRQSFNARDQNQRGALIILDGAVYVAFGGHFGDCGQYHGWVLGVSLKDPQKLTSWATRGRGGGIWAPGGISSDGRSLFVATGNTLSVTSWSDGEAVFRLAPDLHRSQDKRDFFAPPYWRELDETDADLGGTNPIPLDLPAAGGTQKVVLALGKDRHAYLLDHNDLGGIGGSLVAEIVAKNAIRTAPAAYPAVDGVFVALQGAGAQCPRSASDNDLTVLKLRAGAPPSIATAWCGALRGAGAPIVTTTDGRSDPIVWIVGAEGDNRLHGFAGDTGEPLFTGGGPAEAMAGVRRFQTVIAAEDRLYVAADGRVYAFGF